MVHGDAQNPGHGIEGLTLPPPTPYLVLLDRREPVVTHLHLHDDMIIYRLAHRSFERAKVS